ncbi:MAG TPA: excisionase family DNA-binding protein [Verrucomicrobiae bacterium]|nr:excisionase family DNA-binding protein [Verrucomicrobiae bacterium]
MPANMATNEQREPLLISRQEAARLLGVSLRTIEKLIARGEMPSRVLGRRRLIPREFLSELVKGSG